MGREGIICKHCWFLHILAALCRFPSSIPFFSFFFFFPLQLAEAKFAHPASLNTDSGPGTSKSLQTVKRTENVPAMDDIVQMGAM